MDMIDYRIPYDAIAAEHRGRDRRIDRQLEAYQALRRRRPRPQPLRPRRWSIWNVLGRLVPARRAIDVGR
jgi:hypothetical protein